VSVSPDANETAPKLHWTPPKKSAYRLGFPPHYFVYTILV
jgi:hypothetical protein